MASLFEVPPWDEDGLYGALSGAVLSSSKPDKGQPQELGTSKKRRRQRGQKNGGRGKAVHAGDRGDSGKDVDEKNAEEGPSARKRAVTEPGRSAEPARKRAKPDDGATPSTLKSKKKKKKSTTETKLDRDTLGEGAGNMIDGSLAAETSERAQKRVKPEGEATPSKLKSKKHRKKPKQQAQTSAQLSSSLEQESSQGETGLLKPSSKAAPRADNRKKSAAERLKGAKFRMLNEKVGVVRMEGDGISCSGFWISFPYLLLPSTSSSTPQRALPL